MANDLIPVLPDKDIEVSVVGDRITGRIRQAAYTAAALAVANPVLLNKEVVYESDTERMKLGDGTTTWNNLPYFGDVQVGGVNLALNYNKKMQTDSYLIGTINLSTDLVEDDLLTISLDADIDDSQVIYIGLHPSSARLAIASKNSQGIYTVTFKFKKDVNNLDDVSNQLQLYNYPRTGNLVGCVNRIKLERGNKPTDWSPAPEDIARQLAAAKTYAEKLVADVQVGGVNLALNTTNDRRWTQWGDGQVCRYLLSDNTPSGEPLTIRFTTTQVGTTPADFGIGFGSQTAWNNKYFLVKVPKEGETFEYTIAKQSGDKALWIYFNSDTTLHHLSVQTGNKPTDWSPAPEDVDRKIAAAQQTAQAAQAAAAQKIGDAPQDGKKYLRKDGAWNELTDSGGLVYSSSSATTVTIDGGMYLNASATTPITCNIDWGTGAQFAVLVTRGDVVVSLPNRIQLGRVIYKMEGINDLIGTSSQKKVYCFMGINDGNPDSIWNTTYITVNCALYDQL